MHVTSKAGRIWHDPTSVGRKPRRANDMANSLGANRAGFEPRRGCDLALRLCTDTSAGLETIDDECRPHGTAQIRRGITVGDSDNPRRAEIFALPALRHPPHLT
jgi:hypothetical protein